MPEFVLEVGVAEIELKDAVEAAVGEDELAPLAELGRQSRRVLLPSKHAVLQGHWGKQPRPNV
jgi:hypothetical protein